MPIGVPSGVLPEWLNGVPFSVPFTVQTRAKTTVKAEHTSDRQQQLINLAAAADIEIWQKAHLVIFIVILILTYRKFQRRS